MSRRHDPARAARRTPGDILAALAAIAALAALVVGVPLALVSIFGVPVPRHLPSIETLTQPVGVSTVLTVLAVLVWLAWLQLVVCVAVEIGAAVKGVGVPARVPLSGGTQALAHRLVSTALLLFTATVAVAPVLASHHDAAPPRPATAVAADPTPATTTPQAPPREHLPTPPAPSAPKKIYRVQPPHGRHHESLWEIAEKCLGDGRRYKEIYELNKGREQPDGSKLTIASLIRPGWVLNMPDDAVGVELVPSHPLHRTGGARPAPATAGDDHAPAQAGRPGRLPATPQHTAPQHTAPPAAGGPQQDAPSQRGLHFPDELAAATLLAAGLLAALGRRRREQLWRRAFGRRAPLPEGEAALAETALRVGADEPATRLLDLGLRNLSRGLAAEGRTLPTVYAAHVAAGQVSLWVYPPDRNPPAPWQASDQGQVWVLDAATPLDDGELAGTLAPYPGLVTIGANESGRILVDLEAAHGLVAVRGPQEPTRAALAALAVELATNRWSDDLRLTLVGFGDDLVALAPHRMRAVARLADVLPEVEAQVAEMRRALAASGIDSVLTGRCRALGLADPAWTPHYLIVGVPPTPEEATALTRLARGGPRTATGYVVAGDVPGATWTWDLTADGRLRAGVLGLDVRAQLLPDDQCAAVVELFHTASRRDDVPLDPLDPVDPGAAVVADSPGLVEVRMFGRVEVVTPEPLETDRRALATEVVAYLAAHPEGVHPTVLGGAIWPRGAAADVRDAMLARVADWLGHDSLGRPNLVVDMDGRLRLGGEVRVDWLVFRGLVAQAGRAGDPAKEAELLARALDLVRGPLLGGRDATRYSWAVGLEQEAHARVADAAHRLVALRLDAGDAAGAVATARLGLRLAADDAELWRDLVRATHATGDHAALRAVVGELQVRAVDALGGLPPQTEALVEEVLPAWRDRLAN